MDKRKGRSFTSAYNRLMLLTFAVVLAIAFALVGLQVGQQSRHDDAQLVEQFRTRSLAIDNLIVSVGEHLVLMERQAQARLMERQAQAHLMDPAPGRSRLQAALAAAGSQRYALDQVPPPYAVTDVGNLTGDGDLASLPPAMTDELDMALGLNALFPAVQRNIPNAAWVYYTSQRRFINIYPWVPSATARFEEALYRKPFYQLGLPANNPARDTRWTPLYVDAYGKGMMVTATRPLYRGDEFLGTLSIDLTLDQLTAYVRGFRASAGELMIVNEAGELIAHPTATSSSDTRVKRLQDALPAALRDEARTLLAGPALEPTRVAGHVVLWYGMAHAPWKVLYVVAEPSLLVRTLDRAGLDFLVLLGVLTVMLVVMRTATFREFIHPAERLVRHIEGESQHRAGPLPAVPPVPRPWQPWFGEVSRAFAQNRALVEEIHEKNQQLTDMNVALARYTPRFILLVSMEGGSGGTTASHLFADTLVRADASKKTVVVEFPDPARAARKLGLDGAAQSVRHPNGYDVWTAYGLGQVPEDGVSALLVARLLHHYDHVIVHARVPAQAADFVDRRLEPMLRYAKAVFVLAPPVSPHAAADTPAASDADAVHRQLVRQLRRGLRQDRASVHLLACRTQPAPVGATAEADFEIPHVPGPRWLSAGPYESPAAAAAVVAMLVDRIERVHQISAYIPTTIAVDRPADTREVMQRTLTYFTRTFGGATSSQAEGAWNSATAGVVSEQVYRVVSFTTQEALTRHVDDVIEFVRQIKIELAQEAMAIEIDRKLILV